MRPILFHVNADRSPAQMTILFVGDQDVDHRTTTINIKRSAATRNDAIIVAREELRSFTAQHLELLEEQSVPLDRSLFPNNVIDDPPHPMVDAMVSRVGEDERHTGVVHCPLCCRKLGLGTSPAIAYLMTCPGCHAALSVRFPSRDVVTIAVRALP